MHRSLLAPRMEKLMDKVTATQGQIPIISPAFSLMERAPWYIVYALHVPYCLYLMLRYRGITLPTMANPGLEASGLTKESKTELFKLLGPVGTAHLPPFATITTGPFMLEEADRAMESRNLSFPVVVKPDIGRRGFGVKIVWTRQELSDHLDKFAEGVALLIQRYAEGPGEAGIFYVRMPSDERGRIESLTLKHFPKVTGDGVSTIRDLILRDRRARAFSMLYFKRNRRYLERVLAIGEQHQIVSLGNHVRGAAFEDASRHITPAMERVFETIAQEMPGFFIGRFDVRYATLDDLKCGDTFEIVEYNGASGEPIHIWDPNTSIAETYAGLLAHCRYLYAIGAENRARGAQPTSLREIVRRHFDELRLLESYPDEE
jgi:hypothetical protein